MSRAMERWGPDGVFTASGQAGVVGFARLAITPESVHESMPSRPCGTGALFTAAARLDNRDELCDAFGITAGERGTVPDGELAKRAWLAWGEDAPDRLFGDWSYAAWDPLTRTLFLARDHLGNTGLFYCFRPPLFAFSSDPEALFSLDGVERRVSERHIASYLAIFPLGKPEDTCWEGVFRLLPASCLKAGPRGLEARRYWDMGDVPTEEGRRDDDCVAGFLERYREAVTVRLRSRRPVGASLSAGLDSSSVTALAAQALGGEGRTLKAFTSVPLHEASRLAPGTLADEWPLASTVARRYGNIDHTAVDASGVSPLQGIERAVALSRAPQHAAANEYWIMALHDAAREQGLGVMLTGQLGNGGVSWSGGQGRIFWLFAEGRWGEGLDALARWKERTGSSWVGALAGQLIRPWLRPSFKRLQSRLRGAPRPWSEYAPIRPDFAFRMGLEQAMEEARHDTTFSALPHPREQRRLTLMRNGAMAGPIWHVTGAAFGMDVRDPTADARLLRYCLGLPGCQDTFGGGERMVIRRAVEGLVPPEVQWNTVRGRQGVDVALRLLCFPGEMENVLARLEGNGQTAAYLDLPRMRGAWRALQDRITPYTAWQASTLLLRGIMCGCFIEQAGRTG